MDINEEPDEETLNRWHNDPNNWRWGLFYFNPNDPRILVLKRTMFGLTLNFAHPESHIVLAVILLAIVLPIALN